MSTASAMPAIGSAHAALPQRVLVVENSRAYTSILREAIEQQIELPVEVAATLADAARRGILLFLLRISGALFCLHAQA